MTDPRAEAHSLYQRLVNEHKRYEEFVASTSVPVSLMKIQEDFRRYLCMRCAGFLEQVSYLIIISYLELKSGGPALQFSLSFFRKSPNLTSDAFEALIGRFGEDHKSDFAEFLVDNERRTKLNDLLEVRNRVAHGEEMRGAKIDPKPYMLLCREVYEWLLNRYIGSSVLKYADDGQTIVGFDNAPR